MKSTKFISLEHWYVLWLFYYEKKVTLVHVLSLTMNIFHKSKCKQSFEASKVVSNVTFIYALYY